MGHADRLSAPLEVPGTVQGTTHGTTGQSKRTGRKAAGLRGRCALLLLVAISAAGYGAMFYFGQAFLMN